MPNLSLTTLQLIKGRPSLCWKYCHKILALKTNWIPLTSKPEIDVGAGYRHNYHYLWLVIIFYPMRSRRDLGCKVREWYWKQHRVPNQVGPEGQRWEKCGDTDRSISPQGLPSVLRGEGSNISEMGGLISSGWCPLSGHPDTAPKNSPWILSGKRFSEGLMQHRIWN